MDKERERRITLSKITDSDIAQTLMETNYEFMGALLEIRRKLKTTTKIYQEHEDKGKVLGALADFLVDVELIVLQLDLPEKK